MKKIVYICSLMLFCMKGWAQIDLNDGNWEVLFNEEFSGNRSWSSLWEDKNQDDPNHQPLWRCFAYECWGSGVTTGPEKHHAYQPSNAVWGSDGTMKLKGEFRSQIPMHCGTNYSPAPWQKYCHYCDPLPNQHPEVHYYSGTIQTIDPVGYGYFEMECKMPVHDGACSSFWLWSDLGKDLSIVSDTNSTYNEIDIFEHSTNLCPNSLERETLSGVWYNPYGSNLPKDTVNGVIIPEAGRYADIRHQTSTTLEDYHTFGCLWLPEQVVFYVDGEAIGEWNNPDLIPRHPMWLKVTHTEDNDAIVTTQEQDSIWGEWYDEMTINYVKAYYLKSDCETDAVIRSLADFNAYEYFVKNSITLGATAGTLSVPCNIDFTMCAVESITIDGMLEVPFGTEMTLIVQDCPQCSMEGVKLPNYDCPQWDEE